jgi:hypothetical protein
MRDPRNTPAYPTQEEPIGEASLGEHGVFSMMLHIEADPLQLH